MFLQWYTEPSLFFFFLDFRFHHMTYFECTASSRCWMHVSSTQSEIDANTLFYCIYALIYSTLDSTWIDCNKKTIRREK